MAWPLRSNLPDGYFHLMVRAVEGRSLFVTAGDHKRYLGLLQRVIERHSWSVLTFALMGNHAHILIGTTASSLSDGLWSLNFPYAMSYKARYEHFGHVFGGRPKTKPVTDERYFCAVARYIALNPVGVFCDRPEDYRWSAHRALLGQSALPILAPGELFSVFGSRPTYRDFVAGTEPSEHAEIRRWAEGPPEDRPDLESLIADGSPTAFAAAHHQWEYSLRAISRASGINYSAVRRAVESVGQAY